MCAAISPSMCRHGSWVVLAALLLCCRSSTGMAGPLEYAPAITIPAGAGPRDIAVADLNHDGFPDLVVADGGAAVISVFIGNGNGGFEAPVSYDAWGRPAGVALGDLNGDGILDIAVALPDWNYVSVLLGVGAGTFGPVVLTYTHSFTTSVAIASLNNAAPLDVAVTESEYGAVDLLFGLGNGSFSFTSHIATGGAPRSVVAKDLNRDGVVDLVVANSGINTISVVLGTGNGSFAPKTDYVTGGNPMAVAAGDFNRDGTEDLATVNAATNSTVIFSGNGDGTFSATAQYAGGVSPMDVAIADLDGDGALDLVAANSGSNTLSVSSGNGDGSFGTPTTWVVGRLPLSVAVCDVNADGLLDLVSANYQDNTLSILMGLPAGEASTTTLAATPNPSVYGQTVALTAAVSPSSALGEVQFQADGQILGSSALVGGTATLNVSGLLRGDHTCVARYSGSNAHRASESGPLSLAVGLAGTATTVSAARVPGTYRLPSTFSASVHAVPPGSGEPAGSVQFVVDGSALGGPVPVVGGSATSPSANLALGTHQVVATYIPSDTFHFTGSTSPPYSYAVVSADPEIVQVRDVPHDQGGRVFVTWHCVLDQPGSTTVTGYRIWRRVPNLSAALKSQAALAPGRTTRLYADTSGSETFWEAIADLPSAQLVSYGYTAPTTQDSLADSNPYTAFFVQALLANSSEVVVSAPDSGYSVDNLSPPAPASFVAAYGAEQNALHWSVSRAPDLGEFRLYRGTFPDFALAPSNLVVATRDTGYVDSPGTFYYKLVVVDVHGNVSRVAMVSPDEPVATLASLVSAEAFADRIRLTWFSGGNTDLRATVYRRTFSSDWVPLGQILADGAGYLRFEDPEVLTGTRYGYRLGIDDGGEEVFVGETWATAERPGFVLEGARPNPAVGGRLSVQFVLPVSSPARLELFDVSGRRVASADVGGLGPGRHSVDLGASGRVEPGLYVVRFSQCGNVASARVVVLE